MKRWPTSERSELSFWLILAIGLLSLTASAVILLGGIHLVAGGVNLEAPWFALGVIVVAGVVEYALARFIK